MLFFGNGIFVDPRKVETIANWEQPKNVTEIRNFLGLVGTTDDLWNIFH